jgi:hypothetical protein
MKTKRIFSFFAIVIVAMTFYACKKLDLSKISNEAWNPNLAVPLAKGEFSVYDILAKKDTGDLIVVDPNGALALSYTNEKIVLSAHDIASLPDQNFAINQSAGGYGIPTVPSFSATQTFNYSDVISLTNAGGAELYDIDFKSGMLNITASTTLMHSVKFTINLPDLTENGTPVTRVINLVSTGGVPPAGSATVNLNNGFVDLTNGPNGYNDIAVNVSVEITGNGNPIIGTESINVGVNMTGLDFDLVKGYFGNINLFSIIDTVDIKLFNNTTSGNFQITNPSIDLKFSNSFGLPAQVGINSIKTKETSSGTEYPLTGIPTPFNLNGAPSPGQIATSTLSLNTSNTGNMNTILSPTPKVLIFDIDGAANPAGPAINFVKDDSELKLEGTLTLPLEGFATGFLFMDTVEATTSLDPEFVESVLLRLNTSNGFPVEANVKILLVDQNYVLLKDLTNGLQNLIAAAPVNSSGRATTMVQKINDFTLNSGEVPLLKDMKYIIFEVSSQTYQGNLGTIVKFYEDYKFNIRLGMQVQAKVQF